MHWLLILCVVASAGLVSGPADARVPGLEARKERLERREEARRDKRREEKQEHRRDDRREERSEERREEDHEHYTPRRDRSAEAAQRAQQRNGGGRVLSVEPENAGYRVKVIKDGEVRVHHVDPDGQ
jgi:hypothetical protein